MNSPILIINEDPMDVVHGRTSPEVIGRDLANNSIERIKKAAIEEEKREQSQNESTSS